MALMLSKALFIQALPHISHRLPAFIVAFAPVFVRGVERSHLLLEVGTEEAALIQEALDRVHFDLIGGGRLGYRRGLFEASQVLPGTAAMDRPGQNAAEFLLEFVIEVEVALCLRDLDCKIDELDAFPDVLVFDDGFLVGPEKELELRTEVKILFEEKTHLHVIQPPSDLLDQVF